MYNGNCTRKAISPQNLTKMEILFKYAAKFSDNENLTKAIIFATKKAFF